MALAKKHAEPAAPSRAANDKFSPDQLTRNAIHRRATPALILDTSRSSRGSNSLEKTWKLPDIEKVS